MSDLYQPTDLDDAHERFNATCGPCALAAFLGHQVAEVMPYFRQPFPGWCAARDMEAALVKANVPAVAYWRRWPQFGLCWMTLTGPWSDPKLPFGAQLAHSHWVAVRDEMVYDVNAGMWLPRQDWHERVKAWMARTPRADGWKVLRGIEVAR